MGLLGGWWGVSAVGIVALFLTLELAKYLRGTVHLTARQKVVRVLGGILLMAVMLMTVYSPLALRPRPGMARLGHDILELIYWGSALALSLLVLLMGVMDAGEISREYVKGRKSIRSRTLTPEDIDRLLASERKDRPDDVGRGPQSR